MYVHTNIWSIPAQKFFSQVVKKKTKKNERSTQKKKIKREEIVALTTSKEKRRTLKKSKGLCPIASCFRPAVCFSFLGDCINVFGSGGFSVYAAKC